jgi:hypothetical protein
VMRLEDFVELELFELKLFDSRFLTCSGFSSLFSVS